MVDLNVIHSFLLTRILFGCIDGFAMLSTDGLEISSTNTPSADDDQYDKSEYYYIKLGQGKEYDLKVEHFDDMIQDNSFQSSWAGLDSTLIDEEFLYLEDEEADQIYS